MSRVLAERATAAVQASAPTIIVTMREMETTKNGATRARRAIILTAQREQGFAMPASVPVKATSAWAAATASPRCVPPSNATRRGNSTAAQARLQPATSIPRKLSRWVRRPGPNVRTLAAPPRQPDGPREDAAAVPYWIAAAVTAVVLLVLRFAGDALEDADTWGGIAGLDAGDLVGSGLWALILWYCSPAQLLLLFLGKIETERPSDWVMWRLGVAAGLE